MNRFTIGLLAIAALSLLACPAWAQDDLGPSPLFRLPPPPGEGGVAPASHSQEASRTDVAAEVVDGEQAARAAAVSMGDFSYWSALWDPWEGNVELGMNGTTGNTDTFNIRVGATAKHKTATRHDSIQLVYLEKAVNDVQTAQTALADGRIEWPWEGSPWNYFIHGLAEYDQFKAFNTRLSADTGFGYEFIQNDATTLIGRAGLAGSQELGGPDDSFHPELLFGVEYKHKFSDKHSISFKSDYYPAIRDFTDFRLNSQASWEMAVAPEWGLSLKFSVIDRYDSTPHSARPNDLDYSTLLIWAF